MRRRRKRKQSTGRERRQRKLGSRRRQRRSRLLLQWARRHHLRIETGPLWRNRAGVLRIESGRQGLSHGGARAHGALQRLGPDISRGSVKRLRRIRKTAVAGIGNIGGRISNTRGRISNCSGFSGADILVRSGERNGSQGRQIWHKFIEREHGL